jgi:hypothetical protein
MTGDNIFDLSTRQRSDTFDYEEFLRRGNFIPFPRIEWRNLEAGTRVSYITNDDKFRKGGFVKEHNLNKETEEKKYIVLYNPALLKNKNVQPWKELIDNVKRMWKKGDAHHLESGMRSNSAGHSEELRELKEQVKLLQRNQDLIMETLRMMIYEKNS